jgi:imidazolonepropionase-like amidohydrolase
MGQFHYEVEAHVAAGMSPMEAIVAATSDAARSCMVDREVGSLEAGKQADVLVVDGRSIEGHHSDQERRRGVQGWPARPAMIRPGPSDTRHLEAEAA